MNKKFTRYRAKRLEELAKIDIANINCKSVRQKLRRTIAFAEATNRPDRAEWCSILLKKFSQQVPKGGNNGGAKVPE